MQKMKIKDLPKDFILDGCKLNGKYIVSAWPKGFWTTDNYEDYQSGKESEVKPVFFKNFDEIKEWEIEVPLGRLPFN